MECLKTFNKIDKVNGQITSYIPLGDPKILRVNFVELEDENPETKEITERKFLEIEYNLIVEQTYPAPLKTAKRIKQTKSEEYFLLEENIKLARPLIEKVEDPQYYLPILNYFEDHVIKTTQA